MPYPLSTALLVAAAILGGFDGTAYRIIALCFVGLAVANELLRMIVLRGMQTGPGRGQYNIPAPGRTRTVRSPLVPDDFDGS